MVDGSGGENLRVAAAPQIAAAEVRTPAAEDDIDVDLETLAPGDDLDVEVSPPEPVGNIQIEGQWHPATGEEQQTTTQQPAAEPAPEPAASAPLPVPPPPSEPPPPESVNENSSLIERLNESRVSPVQISPEILEEYLRSYPLPSGASIRELQLVFDGQICKVSGKINVPIPLVGGDVDFSLNLQNDQSGRMSAEQINMSTRSAVLRRQLGQVKDRLSQLDQFLVSGLNPQLTKNQINSINLGEGVFLFNVQTETTEPAARQETPPSTTQPVAATGGEQQPAVSQPSVEPAAASVQSPEEAQPDPGAELEADERKETREELLTALIDEFAEKSEEDLNKYDIFAEKTRGERLKDSLKRVSRQAIVYAAFGVGAYALLHAAPLAIAVGAAGGLGGSALGRGLVDVVKWMSGSEKKEQAMRSQLSDDRMERLRNLTVLAKAVKDVETMPGRQAIAGETGEIVTLEHAKLNFLNALIDFNHKESASNPEIAGVRRQYDKSRSRWGMAKGVASFVGGLAGAGALSAGLHDPAVQRITEHGLQMQGEGLGKLAPDAVHQHLTHMHNGEVVFDYNQGELDTIYKAIEAKPALADSFGITSHTKELIRAGMHQAGTGLEQKFLETVNEIAGNRIAEYVAGAVGTAEAADRVWNATLGGDSREAKQLKTLSQSAKRNLGEYQSDLQAEVSAPARQNERFRSIFIDQPGITAENLPSVGQTVPVKSEINLTIPHDGSTRQLTINPGENLQIIGVDQNGNIGVTHNDELLTFTREDFYRYVLAPGAEESPGEDEAPETAEEPPAESQPSPEEWNEAIELSRLENSLKKGVLWRAYNPSEQEIDIDAKGENSEHIDFGIRPGEDTECVIFKINRKENTVLVNVRDPASRKLLNNEVNGNPHRVVFNISDFLRAHEPVYFAKESEENQPKLRKLKDKWVEQFESSGPNNTEGAQKTLPPAEPATPVTDQLLKMHREQQEQATKDAENFKIVPTNVEDQGQSAQEDKSAESSPVENRFEKLDFQYEGGKSVEIKPGQNWKFRQDNWDSGMTNVITKIEPGDASGSVKISFADGSPRTESVENWRKLFYLSELISQV